MVLKAKGQPEPRGLPGNHSGLRELRVLQDSLSGGGFVSPVTPSFPGSQAETGSQALALEDMRVPKAPCPLMVPNNSEHFRSQPHLPEG